MKRIVIVFIFILSLNCTPVISQKSSETSVQLPPEKMEISMPNSPVSFTMVKIPAGEYTKATDEGTSKTIDSFWVGQTETLWDLVDIYIYQMDKQTSEAVDAIARPSKPYVLPGEDFGHTGMPAIGLTYHFATIFTNWLSETTGKSFRLLTEDEWEYICHETQSSVSENDLGSLAWYWDNSDNRTHKPSQKLGGKWEVFDLLGNAWEWVTVAEDEPVVKGGSYYEDANEIGCNNRLKQKRAWNARDPQIPKSKWYLPDGYVGFRLAMDEK